MSPQRRSRRIGPSTRKTSRRWRVPPPLTHGPEPLEGGAVLEGAPGPCGVLLWQLLRDVTLWAGAPPGERSALFAPQAAAGRARALQQAGTPAPLYAVLRHLVMLMQDPGEVDAATLARACGAVAQWAEEEGRTGVALAYTQAVALVDETDAAAAYQVGVLARRQAEHARAETWFRRAVMLARQSADWTSYSLAFAGLGNLYMQRGNLPTARKLHVRAWRAAHRHGLRAVEGMPLHDLFVIASQAGQLDEAESYAAAALSAYGARHPRVPALAHDVAYFWLEQGHFARALPVFRAALPHCQRPAERLRVLADIARAAAGAEHRAAFREAWEQAWPLLRTQAAEEGAAQALLDLAHGAATLGEWARAEEAAARALQLATRRHEGKVRMESEAVLDSVRRGRVARTAAAPVMDSSPSDSLVAELVHSLSSTATPAS